MALSKNAPVGATLNKHSSMVAGPLPMNESPHTRSRRPSYLKYTHPFGEPTKARKRRRHVNDPLNLGRHIPEPAAPQVLSESGRAARELRQDRRTRRRRLRAQGRYPAPVRR